MDDVLHFATLSWQGYGSFLLETLIVLVIIGVTAWVLVRYLRPRSMIRGPSSRMKILERLTVEPKRSLYLVQVDGRDFLLGASEGSIRLITTLDTSSKGEVE